MKKRKFIPILFLGMSLFTLSSCLEQGEQGKQEETGEIIELGEYPQTVFEDSSILTALESATDTDGDGYLNYNSKEYAKVSSATPYEDGYKSISGNTTFSRGSTYYFEVELIKWKVLDSSTG